MADNIAVTAGTGTSIAADDISSVYYQRVKVTHGADGSATDVSTTSPLPVRLIPTTADGCSISAAVSAASTNATSAKASAGQVYGIAAYNINAAARYLKLYNKASAPTVGSDTPVLRFAIPGNTAGSGINVAFPNGIAFGTGIAWALTTGITDADNTGVAVSEILVNILYK